jgi:hypothetical protein
MQIIIQALPYLITLLPFVAFGVSYWLQQPTPVTNTPEQNTAIKTRNATISGASILIVAIVSLLAQGKLTGNPISDMLAVLTLATALQMETFRPLQGFLRGDPPLPVQNGAMVVPRTTRATTAYWNRETGAPPPDSNAK